MVATRRRPAISDLVFAIRIFLERHFARLLLPWRSLVRGQPYRLIPLTQNLFAQVDPEDYAALARHKWSAARGGRTVYAVRCAAGVQIRMHRVIMNAPPHLVCDHIDHHGWHNTKANLRLCTRAQNARNQRRRAGGTSRFKGVSWHKHDRKWHARIYHEGRCHHLGAFASERAAARAYDRAAIVLHGPFASLNFPLWTRLRLGIWIERAGRRKTGSAPARGQTRRGASLSSVI